MNMKKKMRCDDFRVLLSRCQDRELDPMREAALEAHLQSCAPCREERLLLNRLTARVKQLPGVDPGSSFTARVMGKIMENEKVPPLSDLLARWLYSIVFIVFLVLGIFVSSGFSLFHLRDRVGQNQSQQESMVKLLVESQDLSLLNVQDATVALLVTGNGAGNEQ
jgi:predicted anti-sigma-YlaC factor YlaD